MQNPISLTVRLQNALKQPSLVIRCQEITQILQEVSSKDSSYILRTVIESLFGANEEFSYQQSQIGGGWGLRIITVSEHRIEFEALRAFLSPRGPLLTLIYRLSHDPFLLLPFPVSSLPIKVRTEIQEETAGAFYTSKLHNAGPGKLPTNIMLNAFEFYIYHFGHFLVANSHQRWNLSWTSVRDALYPTLLEDYLVTFLSCDASLPPGPPSPPISPRGILSPVTHQRSSGNHLSFFCSPTLHHPRMMSELQNEPGPQQPLHCHSSTEINVWTSHILVQVLMEIWINLCVSPPKSTAGCQQNGLNNSFPSSMSDVFLPSGDHVRAVRMLIKHFHYFANSYKPNQTSPLDPLRRNILNMSRKSLFYFLKHLFTHWPLDSSFRLVLETWLSYIQPWRYLAYSPQESTPVKCAGDGDSGRIIDSHWKEFLAENLLFYTQLFSLLLKRTLRLDLSSSKNAQILFRVAKVFSQDNLVWMLSDLESLLEVTQLQKSFAGCIGMVASSSSSSSAGQEGSLSPQTLLQIVKSHIIEIEKQVFNYTPIFSNQPNKDMYKILRMIKQAFDSLNGEIRLHCEGRRSLQASGGRLDFLRGLFEGIFESGPRDDENSVEEMVRCQSHLDVTYKHLTAIFNISDNDAALLASRTINDRETNVDNTQFVDVDNNLTNFGRHQILTGSKRFDLGYDGDPALKPICTYEVAFLVRKFYILANFLNSRFGDEIIRWFYRGDFLGSIGRVVLEPPTTIYEYQKSPLDSPHKRVAKDLPPRVALRGLANKRILLMTLVLFWMFYLFGVPVSKVFFQLIVPFVFTYVLCKAFIQWTKSPTLNINRNS